MVEKERGTKVQCYLIFLGRGSMVARHGYAEGDPLADGSREDLLQLTGSSFSLGSAAMQAVLELIQGLAHWVGKRYTGVVHKGDVADTPAQ